MKQLILLIINVTTILSSLAQVDSTLILANEAYENGDYLLAYDLYQKSIEMDTNDIRTYKKAGLSAYNIGNMASAKTLFLSIIKRDSMDRMSLSQLASIYERENNAPKAIKYYTQLTSIFPDNSVYWRKLAQQYAQAGMSLDAFHYYNESYKLNNRDISTIKGISEIFIGNKQYEDADTIINKGLQLDSTNVLLYQLLARSKYKQKDYDSTVYYLKRITGVVDLNAYYNKMLGYSYIQIDSFDRAIYYLQKSLTDDGSKEYAYYYLATAYDELDNEANALFYYKKALEEGISSNVPNYHRNIAKLYNENNQLKEAIPHYKDAYKYSDDPVLLFYLARACDVYYKDKSIAINYYNKYIKSKHEHAEYKDYAKSRMRILKEAKHQRG